MANEDGTQAASNGIKAEADSIRAARRAEAETIRAIFTRRLGRITDHLEALDQAPELAETVGASTAFMTALHHCAQAQDELDTLIKNLSKYLVLERRQTRQQVAEHADVTPLTMGRWIKQAESQTPEQDYLDLGEGNPYYG